MDGSPQQHFPCMTAEAIIIVRFDAGMRLVAFIAIQPCHGDPVRKARLPRFSMAGEASVTVWDEGFWLLRGEGMASEAGDLFHPYPVNFPVLVTAETGFLFRPEGVHGPAVAVLTCELLHEHVSRVAR